MNAEESRFIQKAACWQTWFVGISVATDERRRTLIKMMKLWFIDHVSSGKRKDKGWNQRFEVRGGK